MGCAALVLDSSWNVLPCLKIGVNCSCRGLDRRGVRMTREGKEKVPTGADTRLNLRRREQSNGAFPYLHQSPDRHGGTYITSDNFPAQKNRCQDGVTSHTFQRKAKNQKQYNSPILVLTRFQISMGELMFCVVGSD